MLKKGLIKTYTFKFIDENKITNPQQLLDKLPELYKYLKENKECKDLLPKNITYEIFFNYAQIGLQKAVFEQSLSSRLRDFF